MSVIIATHPGGFHADDLFAVAAIIIKLGEETQVEIIRSREPSDWEKADWVVDVGGKNDPEAGCFDHHQFGGAGKRDNGIPYASFGLVWKYLGEELTGGKKAAEIVDRVLVQPIDAEDNGVDLCRPIFQGVAPYKIQNVFFALQPNGEEILERDFDQVFKEALVWAQTFLKREIKLACQKAEEFSRVAQAYRESEDKRVIVLEGDHAWKEVLVEKPEPLYVVYPRKEEGRWGVKAVPSGVVGFDLRRPLPADWGGKQEEELKKITGEPGAIFCHNKRFLCVADSRQAAINLARKALE